MNVRISGIRADSPCKGNLEKTAVAFILVAETAALSL